MGRKPPVHRWTVAVALTVLSLLCIGSRAFSQDQPASDKLFIDAASASTWNNGASDVIQLQGPLTIRTDQMVLTADQAVLWLTPSQGPVFPRINAEIALLGNVAVKMPSQGITRSSPSLLVSVYVRGAIQLTATDKSPVDQSRSELYVKASALRAAGNVTNQAAELRQGPVPENVVPKYPELPRFRFTGTNPKTQPSLRRGELRMHADDTEFIPTADDTLAATLRGNVILLQTRPNHDFLEIRSDRAVVFTDEKASRVAESPGDLTSMGGHVVGAYLEGDVRINYTPNAQERAETRMTAQRVYYDFTTDRAIMTDVVVRTNDIDSGIPITIRAEKLRQLSLTEFTGSGAEMTASSFVNPTLAVRTGQVYIREDQVAVPDLPNPMQQEYFVSNDVTAAAFGIPFFYFPALSGTIDDTGFPLRNINIGGTNHLGFGIATEWGLYELMGVDHPHNFDVSFLADYYDKRGEATGLNFTLSGHNIDSDTSESTDYSDTFKSFLIEDHGVDEFGANRADVTPPQETRGMELFQHQQFLPDDWQVQMRLGYVSDPTLLEEYYPDDFARNQPYDDEIYVKRQEDTEAFTALANFDTTNFVTTSDRLADQFDVEKMPEVGYDRIGDSLLGDNLTFYSENTYDRLRFETSRYSLTQLGFVGPGAHPTPDLPAVGLPAEGYTGLTGLYEDRGDTRQEVDYPIQLGEIKVVPYVIGRATAYSDTISGDSQDRIYGAAGVRLTTDFWRVDDSVQSDLFDLDRVRHIIEPEINLFTSGENIDRDQLYIYDENTDAINDISAAEFALHQRWETYRGPPGRQQSVAFLTWNVYADVFTNPPNDPGIEPDKFRGLFFPSDPEASIPRDAINTDATWLLTNSTAILGDAEYNVDHDDLSTASIGIAAKRGDRLGYYFGLRYIEPLNSNIATFSANYQLTAKYSLQFTQSYDFRQNQNTNSSFTIFRQFDMLTASLGIFHDSTSGDSGVQFNISASPPAAQEQDARINSFFNSD
jgi:hypothetical protein